MLSFVKYKQEDWARGVSECLFKKIIEILEKKNVCRKKLGVISYGTIPYTQYKKGNI